MSESRNALIFRGGWDGHEPVQVSEIFGEILENKGYNVEIYDTQDCLDDVARLRSLDIIIPIWTMGEIEHQRCLNVVEAVNSGVGLVGCHGGMCDAFRTSTLWQFMTGGQWVAHPGGDGIRYRVKIIDDKDSILYGMEDFDVCSEQYYMLVDPAVKVLATMNMPVMYSPNSLNGSFEMPVAWTKNFGYGRIFYTSVGHHADIFDIPQAKEMIDRGIDYAQYGKDLSTRFGWNETSLTGEQIAGGL